MQKLKIVVWDKVQTRLSCYSDLCRVHTAGVSDTHAVRSRELTMHVLRFMEPITHLGRFNT